MGFFCKGSHGKEALHDCVDNRRHPVTLHRIDSRIPTLEVQSWPMLGQYYFATFNRSGSVFGHLPNRTAHGQPAECDGRNIQRIQNP